MACSVSSLLYFSIASRAIDLDYPRKDPRGHEVICVLGSVNGLFYFSTAFHRDFILWNPSIRKFKKLPNYRRGCGYMNGFGYDELHEDYKVMLMCSPKEVNTYSLNSDSWRRSTDDDLPSWWRLDKSEGIFVNGKLHWANNTSENDRSYNSWSITCIDLADGKWGNIELPCYGERDFNDITPWVAVLGSELCVSCNSGSSRTDVWIMKEYGVKESWTKMFTIKPPNRPRSVSLFCTLFCTSNKGEFLFKLGSAFMIYNPKGDFIRSKEVTNCGAYWGAQIYIEKPSLELSPEGT